MIIVRVRGRLGNQLFQYAIGRSLALERGMDLYLDLLHFKHKTYGCQLGLFQAKFEEASPLRIGPLVLAENMMVVMEPALRSGPLMRLNRSLVNGLLQNAPRLNPRRRRVNEDRTIIGYDAKAWREIDPWEGDLYLDGFWQSERCFAKHADAIREDLRLKGTLRDRMIRMRSMVQDEDSVSVHIRRGDYASQAGVTNSLGCCDVGYYARAVAKAKAELSHPRFFVFSDDIEWAKGNLNFEAPTTFVSGEFADFEEMHLMSACRGHIIANSTFSWWAAWMDEKEDKFVIGPERWAVSDKLTTVDNFPSAWIKV